MVTAAVAHGRNTTGLRRDLVLVAALLLGVTTFIVAQSINADYPLISVLLGSIVAAFVLALDTPVWAVVPLLLVELSIKYYQLMSSAASAASSGTSASTAAGETTTTGVTLRLIVVAVAVLLSLTFLWRDGFDLLRLRGGVRVLLPAVVLIVIAMSFDLPREPADIVIKYVRYQVTQVAALVLVACLVRRPTHLRLVLGVGLAVTLLSGALAILQYVDPVNAPVAGPVTTAIGTEDQAGGAPLMVRAVGLSSSPVQLAGALSVALPILLGFLLAGGVRSRRSSWLMWLVAGVLCMATYLTYTRAAVVAVAASLAVIAFFLPIAPRVGIWIVLGGAAVMFLLLEGTGVIGQRYYATASNDNSTAAHLALFEVGTQIALDNPVIGIGHAQFQDVAVGYAGIVSADAHANGSGSGTLGSDPPHDDFLLVWISWGLPGLAAYVAIFVGTAFNCILAAARTRSRFVRASAVAVMAGLTGYAVSSTFHNYLDSSILLWLLAGLSIGLAHMSANRVRVAPDVRPAQVSTAGLRQRLAMRRPSSA